MTRALANRHDHLAGNRRMIIGRSIAAAIAGAIPIPMVEEWLSSTVKRGTIRRVAEAHAIDCDEDAIRAVADGLQRPPEWTDVASGTILLRILSRTWRKLVIGLVVARRAKAAAHSFVIGTLFDHYCARLHVGLGLDGPGGAQLRVLMGKAISETEGGLSRHLFRRGTVAAARATLRAPVELANIVSRGAVRRLLSKNEEYQAITEVDEHVERQLSSQKSFLGRAALAIELQLAVDQNPYLDDLIDTFEALWRKHQDAASTTSTSDDDVPSE